MPKPDLSNVRRFTPAEREEWRRFGGKKPPAPKRTAKRKKRNKQGSRMPGRKVVVACISIRPELKLQAERWIGGGNFSKAVTTALNKMLMEMTDDAARSNQAQNRS
jgi:hypothetical protein